jgi:hypothetical protein
MAETISSPFRSQHGVRLVGATDSHEMARTIAGSGRLATRDLLAAEIGERNLPWELDVGESEQGVPGPDAGQFLMMSSSRRRVIRTVWRSDDDIERLVVDTAWVAEHPVVAIGDTPDVVEETEPEPERGEPSMDWSRDELADEVERLTGVRPSLHPSGRPPKRDLLTMIDQAKQAA